MKKLLMLILVSNFGLSLNAMPAFGQPVPAEQEATCSSTSDVEKMKVLQEQLLTSLTDGKYDQVSALMEKEDVVPCGEFCTYLDKGIILGMHIANKTGGISYLLFKAAHEAGHTKLITFLAEKKQLCYAAQFEAAFRAQDPSYTFSTALARVISAHPLFREQEAAYRSELFDYENRARVVGGKKPFLRPRSEAGWRAWENLRCRRLSPASLDI